MYWAILSYCGPQLDVFVTFLKEIQGICLTMLLTVVSNKKYFVTIIVIMQRQH